MFFLPYQICKEKIMKKIANYIFLIAFSGYLGSCKSPADKLTKEQETVKNQVDSIQLRVEASNRAMSNTPEDSLLYRLHEDSKKGLEPFNSKAYRELVRRKNIDGGKLRASVNTSDQSSILNLLALRALAAEQYRQVADSQKISILTDALAKSKTFNMWGLPNLKMEAAAHALIECGEKAVPILITLLSDCRPAEIWGDEEYQIYKKFKFRACDYSLTLIKRIQEKEFVIPESVEERDRMIEVLKRGK
jgi:hypothetical protein